MPRNRVFILAESAAASVAHIIEAREISLADGQSKSIVTLCKVGKFYDPRYDWFDITKEMFLAMIRNFEARVFAQDVAIDIEHNPKNGAAGFIRRLFIDGNRLRAEVEWTPMGVEAITQKGFRYLSAEFDENFSDNETGTNHGAVLKGAALTTRPVIKGLDPVTLSATDDAGVNTRYLLSEHFYNNHITERTTAMKDKLLQLLLAAGVPGSTARTLSETTALTGKETETDVKALAEKISTSVKALAQTPEAASAQPAASAKTLSESDIAGIVTRALAEEKEKATAAQKALAEQHEGNKKLLAEIITASKLSDDDKKALSEELLPGITAGMPAEAVKALAALAIGRVEKAAAAQKLANLGFGHVQITRSEEQGALQLAEEKLPVMMGRKTLAEIEAEKKTPVRLASHRQKALSVALAQFDRQHGPALSREAMLVKELADGSTNDILIPRLVQRQVLIEAYQSIAFTPFIEAITGELNSSTIELPTEYREGVPTDAQMRVPQGTAIPYGYLKMGSELGYVNPFKLATKMTNEAIHFSRNNLLGHNLQDRSITTLITLFREMTDRRVANELLISCDEYGAAAVANEALTAQCEGTNKTFQLANWPLVPTRKVYDLQNNLVSTANPITVTYNAVARSPWEPGVAAGIYYLVTNYNLGQFQIVDETGAAIIPAAATPLVVSYSYSTNVIKFDTDVPGGSTNELHLNGLLSDFGKAKVAVGKYPRFGRPDLAVMSEAFHNTLTDAQKFEESHSVPGNSLDALGNLATVKGVSCLASNAPGLLIGDSRAIFGARGVVKHGIAKSFSFIGDWQERRDANGFFTGEKDIYGEQFDVMKVPAGPNSQIKGGLTSVLIYSATTDIGPF